MNSKAKPSKRVYFHFTLIFCLFVIFNGCNQQKVIEKRMASDPVIQAVFSKNEIKELAEIRLMIDKMVLAQTGEANIKTAYEKFIASLGKVETADEISTKIPLSHDSLIQIVKANYTFKEIWKVNDKTKSTSISLNLKGKGMEFLKKLSKENTNYISVLEGIETAGDISPSVISDFLVIPARYNWESEAEKLYATTVLVILTNRSVSKADLYIQKAVKFIQDFKKDSALIWIDKAIAIDSTNHAALYTKAGILINTNNHREALDLLTKCTTIEPEIAETWGMMGMVNDYLGETEEAARCYDQTIELYNRRMESGDKEKIHIAKLNKAMMLRMNNQESESRQLFKELLNENPADSTVANLSRRSKQDYLNDLKPYQTGGYKEKPKITIKNSADYSQTFIDEFKKSMLGYKTLHLDKNKIIINGTHVEYFPDFIPIGQKIKMNGKNDVYQVELEFTRINQTTIRYNFKTESNAANQFAGNGEAHLPPYFFYGDESIVDNKTGKGYFGHDFIDRQTGTLIKIVEGEENKILATVSYSQLDYRKCPVLSSTKTDWDSFNAIKPSDGNKTEYLNLGNIEVEISLKNNTKKEINAAFNCNAGIKVFKNNAQINQLYFNLIEPVGDRAGLVFSSQPIKDLIIISKYGDYDGRIIIISEKGQIQNYRGGSYFITGNGKFIVSPWHSDLSGITVYDAVNKKVVAQKESQFAISDWYLFQDEYYTVKWENSVATNEFYHLDLQNFELKKSRKTPEEIKTGKLIALFNNEFCMCN